jgi:hypothetical protein
LTAHRPTFRSEYGEDAWIYAHCQLPASGFYVDIGCAYPDHNSNTSFLRQMGWKGIAIDGNPAYAPDWAGRSEFVCAVLSDSPDAAFEICVENPAMSRITGRGSNHTVNLNDLLESEVAIDFLSIDIEGHEFDVLNTLNWNLWQPDIIVAEYATLQPDGKTVKLDYRVRDMLLATGYREIHRTVANIVYELK